MKKIIYIVFILLFVQKGYTQQASYKDSINELVNQTRKKNKVYNDHDKQAKRKYFYHKKTKKIVSIVIAPEKSNSAFQYEFINNELVVIKLYLPYTALPPASVGKKRHGIYYFKKNTLVDKDELNYPQIDLEQFRIQALELYERALKFLKNKGISLENPK